MLRAPIPCIQYLLLSLSLALQSEVHVGDNLCEARKLCRKITKLKEGKVPTMVDSQYLFNGEVSAQLLFPDSAYCHSFLSTEEQLVIKVFIN